MADLKITSVTAARDGGFSVTFLDGTVSALSLGGADSHPHAGLLIAWLRAGNVAAKWVPTLEDARREAISSMSDWIERFLTQFTRGVPAAEIASWSVKATAAAAHLAGKSQPMILAEASLTGEDPMVLAQTIVAKSGAYTTIIATVTGLRRATETAIGKAKSREEVLAALTSARTRAATLANSLGITP
jgi:hypothetical protein